MSPSSRGLVPGLFLALAAALSVLGANAPWLLPAQGETGVRFFTSAPLLARGEAPLTPWIPAGEASPQDALAGRGRLMPALMAGLIRQGAKPYISALWVLAGSAAVAVLALAWSAGGVAGIWGAVVAGLVLLVAPATLEAVTVLGPDVLLGAMAALLLGTLTYRPRASALHGAVGAAAWLAHPAGVGLVAVAMVWPFRPSASHVPGLRRFGAAFAGAAPSVLLMAVGTVHPLFSLPSVRGGDLAAAGAALSGALRFFGAGLPGPVGAALGGVVMVALVALVMVEARSTPAPPPDPRWSDPAAPDALALTFRPGAALVTLGALLGSWAMWTGEALSAPWFAATIPLAALAGAAAVRWKRRRTGLRGWLPGTFLVLWMVGSALGSWRSATRLRETGGGFTSAHWVASPLIRWIDNESRPYQVLYVDEPALIFLQTGRASQELQAEADWISAFVPVFEAAPGAVVLTGEGLPQAEALAARLGLRTLVEEPQGRVLAR